MFGSVVVTLGQIHARYSQVYFTNNTWTVLRDTGKPLTLDPQPLALNP